MRHVWHREQSQGPYVPSVRCRCSLQLDPENCAAKVDHQSGSSAVDSSQIIAGTNSLLIYSRAVTRHVVNGPPVMSLMCLNVLYVWNVVHVCRLDSLVTQPCHLLYDDSSQDALLAGRDPLLSRSLFEQDERQEVDLLFRELERILSPAPDRESVSSDSRLLRATAFLFTRTRTSRHLCPTSSRTACKSRPVPGLFPLTGDTIASIFHHPRALCQSLPLFSDTRTGRQLNHKMTIVS